MDHFDVLLAQLPSGSSSFVFHSHLSKPFIELLSYAGPCARLCVTSETANSSLGHHAAHLPVDFRTCPLISNQKMATERKKKTDCLQGRQKHGCEGQRMQVVGEG